MRNLVFAANWKMNKSITESMHFIPTLVDKLGGAAQSIGQTFSVIVAPSFTHLGVMAESTGESRVQISSQNCGVAKSGAYTGEISPAVLKELGCEWTIIGHSERRHIFKEDDILILARLRAARAEDLGVIFCVGETLQDRKAGKWEKIVENQLRVLMQLEPKGLKNFVLAYEPVWAIGTGENATPAQADEVHACIRSWISKNFSEEQGDSLRILYGGSVKPENSESILSQPNIDGLLVGGASLDPVVFSGVILNGLKGKNSR